MAEYLNLNNHPRSIAMPDLAHNPNRLNFNFTPSMEENAAHLAAYFFDKPHEELVADTLQSFSIRVGHREDITAVGPGKYKSALFLMYLVEKFGDQSTGTLTVSPDTIEEARHYFSPEVVADAARCSTKHTTARFLLHHPGAEVTLKFKSKAAAAA